MTALLTRNCGLHGELGSKDEKYIAKDGMQYPGRGTALGMLKRAS